MEDRQCKDELDLHGKKIYGKDNKRVAEIKLLDIEVSAEQ